MDSRDFLLGGTVAGTLLAPVVSYVAIFFVTARASGWTELSRRWQCRQEPVGKVFRWRSLGAFRIGGYNNCVRFVVSGKGLYLALQWPFNAFHTPLLIPWDSIRRVKEGKSFGVRYVEIEMPTAGKRHWKILGSVAEPAEKNGWLR